MKVDCRLIVHYFNQWLKLIIILITIEWLESFLIARITDNCQKKSNFECSIRSKRIHTTPFFIQKNSTEYFGTTGSLFYIILPAILKAKFFAKKTGRNGLNSYSIWTPVKTNTIVVFNWWRFLHFFPKENTWK